VIPQPVTVSIETAPDDWMQYVQTHKDATGYHDWRWRDVFKGAFGHNSFYLAARAQGAVVGVLPLVLIDSWLFRRALISLPFLNYGGIVADDRATALALLERATALGREKRCRHIELRHTTQQLSELPSKRHKVAMLLELKPPSALWDGLDRKVRNQVRKAQKSGLTYHPGGRELLDEFYAVFARNMRDLGTPVYGRSFFEHVLDAFPTQARVHVVRNGSAAIAAGLTFQSRQTLEIPWASSIREFNSLCSNHLLYWSILEAAAAKGCSTFDFGRSTPNEGTYKFKEQWGAQPLPLVWEYQLLTDAELPNSSPTNPKFSVAISAWKMLPLAVTNRLGPAIVRSIP